ncbi:hypothetical protein BBK82_09185 [Lentzea guizhouensis]|uniref:Recombinase domain-containing protein n=1 Tax=Lentzea guizhouensis TaxID=1586287 RepID=A0A1B2HY17_9PSEU|nr:hypothetical protein BBK82_09185 [Lentzea guizhouensis]
MPVFDSYARLSWNPNTLELEKVEDQHKDNQATIHRHGGSLGLELSDGLSAWKKNVKRPDFERLLDRAAQRLSQGIAIWHVDRLFRQPRDLERLIDLADNGFLVISSHGTRNLSDPDDRFILRIEVAHAARSSDDASRRITRRMQAYRERGRTVGGRPGFGMMRKDLTWKPGPKDKTDARPYVSESLVKREQAALRKAVHEMSLNATDSSKVARLWNEQGLGTTDGGEWIGETVRQTLLRPQLAGRLETDGVVVGRLPGEPVVDEKEWLRVRAMMESRRRGAAPGRKYLASGMLRCGVCGNKLTGRDKGERKSTGGRIEIYYCRKRAGNCGSITVDQAAVDRELRSFVVSRLSDPHYAHAISLARAEVSGRLRELAAEIEEIEALQQALSEKLGRRQISLKTFEASHDPLMDDLTDLQAEYDELSGGAPEGPTTALAAEQIDAKWADADVVEKRAMLANAMGPLQIRILPSPKEGKRVFDRDRMITADPKAPFLNGKTRR